MAEGATIPEKVHLVGSIGLDGVAEVFRTAGKMLGRRLKRIPDGEPGGRRLPAGVVCGSAFSTRCCARILS
jgi:hypothetical protein